MLTKGNMKEANKCNGRCKNCNLLGECPADVVRCDTCGEVIEPGDGVEVETEEVYRGRHYPKTVEVCRGCYERFYLSDNMEDLIF